MLETREKPLITFAVAAFSQQRFIRQAVAGAFAQTYSPLEIILSDDKSTDGTWGIMREMAASYDGPHRVVLNQNRNNLGVGAHVNAIASLAHGELIVPAAGDDISDPRRTERIHEAWEQSGRRAMAFSSHVKKIDDQGQPIGELRCKLDPCSGKLLHRARVGCWTIVGCSEAWHRSVFETFGPLREYVVAEDRAVEFRALALGPVVVVDAYLVQYRVHGGNLDALPVGATKSQQKQKSLRNLRALYGMFRQFLDDLDRMENLALCPLEEIQLARRIIVGKLGQIMMEEDYEKAGLARQFHLAAKASLLGQPRLGLYWLLKSLHLR
jgi:glycosyltransferase involved in cell wall biosynthesis